jgi:hypothetical protein
MTSVQRRRIRDLIAQNPNGWRADLGFENQRKVPDYAKLGQISNAFANQINNAQDPAQEEEKRVREEEKRVMERQQRKDRKKELQRKKILMRIAAKKAEKEKQTEEQEKQRKEHNRKLMNMKSKTNSGNFKKKK